MSAKWGSPVSIPFIVGHFGVNLIVVLRTQTGVVSLGRALRGCCVRELLPCPRSQQDDATTALSDEKEQVHETSLHGKLTIRRRILPKTRPSTNGTCTVWQKKKKWSNGKLCFRKTGLLAQPGPTGRDGRKTIPVYVYRCDVYARYGQVFALSLIVWVLEWRRTLVAANRRQDSITRPWRSLTMFAVNRTLSAKSIN